MNTKTQVSVNLSTLKAVAHGMAIKDVRYYLNGVFIDAIQNDARIVASNGHCLFAAKITATACDAGGFIIDGEMVRLLLKIKASKIDPAIDIEFDGDMVRASCFGVTYTAKPIDGKYVDYRRVIPAKTTPDKKHNNRIDTALLLNAKHAMACYVGKNKNDAGYICDPVHSDGAAVMVSECGNFIGLVMPLYSKDDVLLTPSESLLSSWKNTPAAIQQSEAA